ncbi:MAG: DNA translocase FtsK, partial [Patescibacteria group bacterium]
MKKKRNDESPRFALPTLPALQKETKHGVLAITFFVLGLIFVLAWLGLAGRGGAWLYSSAKYIFGWGFFLFPLVLFLVGGILLQASRPRTLNLKTFGAALFFLSGLGLLESIFGERAGGAIGRLLSRPVTAVFDHYISLIIFVGLVVISSLVMFDTRITLEPRLFGWSLGRRRSDGSEIEVDEEIVIAADSFMPDEAAVTTVEAEEIEALPKMEDETENEGAEEEGDDADFVLRLPVRSETEFESPPLSLLERDSGKPVAGDIKANANIIKRTLGNFGIVVEMDEVSIGPSITRYALKPAEGVKISRILALQKDLALALAAHPIRIEAPIPGLALVGIEIPNRARATVGLASLVGAPAFTSSPFPLFVSLGRDIAGAPHFSNIARAPHVLIAGTTGSGKSVVIHTFITSLLYRNHPTKLRFIMIDPKRVELTLYRKIPHLLTPVVTDPKKAISSLRWAIKEMERRYEVLEKERVRDIQSFHQSSPEAALAMPYIVIVIDELADIMSTYPRELEAAIVRLAQMSRAVGIHLILSTQRPSVEVITGLIKANIPSRVALQVASQIDSRTIIDESGAEKLLGAGDMLYLSGERSKPLRLQSAYISEAEVKRTADWLAEK